MNPKTKLPLIALVALMAGGATGCATRIHSAYASPAASHHNTRARITAALSPHGSWVMTSQFGRAWQPYGMASDWRPYTVGYWNERGDDMVWHSDFEWGWAAFHYGRWTQDSNYGWVWIAGDQWSPGWVVWRTDGDYVGWAPAPPAYVGYNVTVINTVPIGWWCFIPRVYIGHRHWRTHRVHHRYNNRHVRRGRVARSHRHYRNDRRDRGRHVDARRPRGTPAGDARRGTAARRGRPAGSRNDGPVVGHTNSGRNDGRGARPGNDNRGRANDGRGARPGNGRNDGRGNDGRGARPGNSGRDDGARAGNGFGRRPGTASSNNGRIDTGRTARPSSNGSGRRPGTASSNNGRIDTGRTARPNSNMRNRRGNYGGSSVANTGGPSANTGNARQGQRPTFGSRNPPKQRTPVPGTNARSNPTTKQASGSRGQRFTPHKEVRRIPDRKIERRPVSTRPSRTTGNTSRSVSRSSKNRSSVSRSSSRSRSNRTVRSSRSSRSPSRSTGRSSRSSRSRKR